MIRCSYDNGVNIKEKIQQTENNQQKTQQFSNNVLTKTLISFRISFKNLFNANRNKKCESNRK